MTLQSAIYEGSVRHRRFAPVDHEFRYSIYMMYIDLKELPSLFDGSLFWSARRPAIARFRREDYFGNPNQPLDTSIRNLVAERTGTSPKGPIRLLTHLRYFGFIFNPVSFYYIFDERDEKVQTIVAEITNTPWQERHAYVLDAAANEGSSPKRRHRFRKDFHVSPFLSMDYDYDWRFSHPGKALNVHMENLREGKKHFDATMTLQRRPFTSANLTRALLKFPAMTAQVTAGIYWQAMKLWFKGAIFHEHPHNAAQPLDRKGLN